MERTLLLVDDEQNILSSLTRLLRRDGYAILTADSGAAGLAQLDAHAVGVILSDQRMPGMTGAEFLSEVKRRHPETVRIMLSGYTELNSVTDAINRGAIYKFLTKPWDDELLRNHIRGAFEQYEMVHRNTILAAELQHANAQLAAINESLEARVKEQTREVLANVHSLRVAQHILDILPIAVLGVGEDGMIAFANQAAQRLVGGCAGQEPLIGAMAKHRLPHDLCDVLDRDQALFNASCQMQGVTVPVSVTRFAGGTLGSGRVALLFPEVL